MKLVLGKGERWSLGTCDGGLCAEGLRNTEAEIRRHISILKGESDWIQESSLPV